MIKNTPRKLLLLSMSIFLLTACETNEFLEENSKTEKEVKENSLKPYEKWYSDNNMPELEAVISEELSVPILELQSKASLEKREVKKPVYVHYMPWFQSKEIDGYWGQHWTMTNQNPDNINSNGERQIASYYYPKIGPYSTKDKDLQQYHLLLMKLSGVNGVIFDWYGIRDVRDFNNIKEGMESFLKELNKTDMEFAVMYEDRVVHEQGRGLSQIQISQAKNDLQYIESAYFDMGNYIRINNKELLMIFGPNYITEKEDWTQILRSMKKEYNVLPLWNSQDIIGSENTKGEFAWIDKDHLMTLDGYYNYNVDFDNDIIGGVSYPGFHDFYVEGGWKSPLANSWIIEHSKGKPLKETFIKSKRNPVDFIQVAT